MTDEGYTSQPMKNATIIEELGDPLCVLVFHEDGTVKAHHPEDRVDVEESQGLLFFRRKGKAEASCVIGELSQPTQSAPMSVYYIGRAQPGSGPVVPPPLPPPEYWAMPQWNPSGPIFHGSGPVVPPPPPGSGYWAMPQWNPWGPIFHGSGPVVPPPPPGSGYWAMPQWKSLGPHIPRLWACGSTTAARQWVLGDASVESMGPHIPRLWACGSTTAARQWVLGDASVESLGPHIPRPWDCGSTTTTTTTTATAAWLNEAPVAL